MRQTANVVYLAIDELIPSRGPATPGLDEFSASLDHAGIPCVWLTGRTRLQIDEPRRKMGHHHPFIAEDGCGVFLPEDYFHLKPQTSHRDKHKGAATIRLGRFTCLPIAEPQPAAGDALEQLATDTGVSVVPLRSLAPRELAQNTGLHARDAELARQHDFDEVFFFAGASQEQIASFTAAAQGQGADLRQHGALWSLAIGASISRSVRALSKLYDRALHSHANTVCLATSRNQKDLVSACDRAILLADSVSEEGEVDGPSPGLRRVLQVPLSSLDKWERLSAHLLGGARTSGR